MLFLLAYPLIGMILMGVALAYCQTFMKGSVMALLTPGEIVRWLLLWPVSVVCIVAAIIMALVFSAARGPNARH